MLQCTRQARLKSRHSGMRQSFEMGACPFSQADVEILEQDMGTTKRFHSTIEEIREPV